MYQNNGMGMTGTVWVWSHGGSWMESLRNSLKRIVAGGSRTCCVVAYLACCVHSLSLLPILT